MRNRYRSSSNTEIVLALIGVGVAAAAAFVIALLGRDLGLESLWSAFAVIGVLVAIVWVLHRLSLGYDEPRYGALLTVAILVKAAAAAAQHAVTSVVYEGRADANKYHELGAVVAGSIRSGSFEAYEYGSRTTTNLVTIVGWIYAAIGSSQIGGIAFFTALSLIGAFLFDRAVRRAAPGLDLWRYSVLIYLVPTVAFWPSAIGKDAWMMLMIGIVTNGFSLLVAASARWSGIPWVVVGLAGSSVVRPHVALILVASLAMGLLFMGTLGAGRAEGRTRRRVLQLTALVCLAVGATFVAANAEQYFGVDSLTAGSVETILDDTQTSTSTGTVIGVRPVRTPVDVPVATVTVLFRPFPWEAPNALGLISSLESLALLVLLGSRLRPRQFLRAVRGSPLVVFATTYVVLFIIAFSNIENAGILARQRTQMIPLLLIFAALPKPGTGAVVESATESTAVAA